MSMDSDELLECLPADLRAAAPTVTRIAAGLSGAGVFRVEGGGPALVLKVARDDELFEDWRQRLDVLRLVSESGLAPRVIHVDESRRAVLSELVVDAGLAPMFGDPRTRSDAVALVGRTLRRVHDLPAPEGLPASEPLVLLDRLRASVAAFPVPRFVLETLGRLAAEQAPPPDRDRVLSHNDVNPTNLVFDGTRLLLLDWDTAASNDPLYDLAAVSVFFRMDEPTCLALLASHDGIAGSVLPTRFSYFQRLVAGLCGAAFVHLARHSGFAGDSTPTLGAVISLHEFYQRLRMGQTNVRTPGGQWMFGLALIKASHELGQRST